AEIIRGINKFSNNVMARQLLLTLGWKMIGEPGTSDTGSIAVKQWARQHSINMPSLFIDNGSGLSRSARASAQGLGELLEFAYRHPYRSEFMASLPLIGLEGSIARRFTKGPLKGRVRIKTGLINGVRAMAGYVYSQTGRTYIVVSLQEHPTIHQGIGTAVQNALLRWVFLK
ncbi:MAG: D-alanyl-D-alanine carboxypeptidase, partial [Gammaproteobacteria bacterium]|nr:D-alanyl-D-alanine carboxypeptidase [Gammaproteobacteria bacterium]